MRIVKRILLGILVLLVVAAALVFWKLKQASPKYEGNLTLPSLSKKVEVYHDDFGVPHIYADNKEDAYQAFGYLHAQERLFQMELLRRIGAGTLSEVLGPDLLEVDKLFRTIGTNEKAKEAANQQFANIDTEAKRLSLAYLKGINAFIENGATPPEFLVLGIKKTAFEPADLFRIVGYMGFSFAVGLRTDPLMSKIYEQLGADYYKDCAPHPNDLFFTIPSQNKVTIDSLSSTKLGSNSATEGKTARSIQKTDLSNELHWILAQIPVPLFIGSNSWVVSPDKTQNKIVLFCNDAHIQYSQPAVWWEAHIQTPDFSLYGNFLAGFPFALIGHTPKHAWGLTMFENDDMDFYYEKLTHKQVMYKNEWHDFKTRVETYKVKGSDKLIYDTIKITPHGPIINGVSKLLDSNKMVSMYWTQAHLPLNAVEVAYQLANASDIKAFESSLAQHNAPGLNFMYGDAKGNIAWWAVAKLVKRASHVDPKLILNGWSGADEPLGFYPFEENPHSINPPEGFVYSANNPPDKLYDSTLYPGYYYIGARGKVISDFLSSSKNLGVDDMKTLLMNNEGPYHVQNIEIILKHLKASNKDQEALIEKMKSWNGNHEKEAIEPTVYYALMYHILQLAMEDELGDEDFQNYLQTLIYMKTYHNLMAQENSVWWDNIETEHKETKAEIINQAFEICYNGLKTTYGSDFNQWKWSKAFGIAHKHPLGKVALLASLFNIGPEPLSGGLEVVNKQTLKLNNKYKYESVAGPSMRIIIDFSAVENAESVIPTGQSGHVASKHYKDQFPLHINGQFRAMEMNEERIKKNNRFLLFKPKDLEK